MNLTKSLHCVHCDSNKFIAKHKATYIYSYKIDTYKNTVDDNDNLSFEFDRRENGDSTQYLQCENCGAKYPCDFNLNPNEFDFTILQQAVRSDHTTKPEFLG